MTGGLFDPFDNLFDAIERAYEIAATEDEQTVTIKLLEGDHYLKKEKREFQYRALKVKRGFQNLKLIIKSS